MAGKLGVVCEMPLRSERNVLGFGFTIGDRCTISLVYRTEEEAKQHWKRVLDAMTAAVESVERWAPDKR